MARWITVREPFEYRWPDRSAITHFHTPGDFMVKDEVADFAIEKGYAAEGKSDQKSRSRKGTGARRRKEKPAANAADTGSVAGVGDANAPNTDRTADRPAVDSNAG